MSAEAAPLLFAKRLGSLRPVNGSAKRALDALDDGTVTIKITKANRNQRRRAVYWIMLDVAADALTDATGTFFDADMLHDILRDKLGLVDEVTLPSGDIYLKRKSTSDRAMSEPDRAAWMDRCAKVLSHWLHVEIDQLMEETRKQAA